MVTAQLIATNKSKRPINVDHIKRSCRHKDALPLKKNGASTFLFSFFVFSYRRSSDAIVKLISLLQNFG